MTSASGVQGPWKYRFGLLLILAVVLIWVASAEVTQLIFEKYRHPFLLTWLGASLLVIYLPIAYIKEWASQWTNRCQAGAAGTAKAAAHPSRPRRQRDKAHLSADSLAAPDVMLAHGAPPRTHKEVEMAAAPSKEWGGVRPRSPREEDEARGTLLGEDEEEALLLGTGPDAVDKGHAGGGPREMLTTREMMACALLLAPVWLLTEYLSNAALSMTSVASTTILSSTSGLFTLLFGVTLGGEKMTSKKLAAALVSIAGVIMTELGKSSAADDQTVFGDPGGRKPGESVGDFALPGHNLVGDICGLLSAVSYGFYTTLLRKYVGSEEGGEEKADVQKVFGFIGLFTLIGLWWLVFPLNLIGLEPVPRFPSSYGLDEDILANALVGSVISDYFWALSVLWTTPLVATLGLSLTIPLAMVADMVMHGRLYSLVYTLGALAVFAGFFIANLGDGWTPHTASTPDFFSPTHSRAAAASRGILPQWLWPFRRPGPAPSVGLDAVAGVTSDKEND